MDMENLLEEAMKELPDEQARKIANEDGLQYSDVHTLELDFRSKTVNEDKTSFGLTATGISNRWPNLSSNNIKKIEGLENLRKLEMLLLAKNKISVIENMDTLEELTIFNIGHNCIEHRDNVFYLRRFKKLFTLCLFGNPAFQDDDYTSDITSQFPQLMYLDYKLCRDSTVNTDRNHSCIPQDAFVEFLNGSHLFDSMFGDDEAEMLQSEPEVALSQFCNQLFELGLGEQKRREAEVNLFYSGQRQTLRDEQEEISDILTTFEEKHEKVSCEATLCGRQGRDSVCVSDLGLIVSSCLLQDIMALLETNISDMVYTFVTVCRDLESSFYKKISENRLKESVSLLFTGGETLMKKLAVSHDNRLEKLKNREAQLIERLSAWKVDLLKEIKDKHIKQNHFRVTCIYAYIKHFKDQLEELQ
uniref:Dynein regulatory complex subunit 3 n=1 Tax=Takifugu rubripes TaxID=31033 RepID=A0A3B5K6D4_TAKRU